MATVALDQIGLLERFGRPTFDGVALVGSLRRLERRIERAGGRQSLRVERVVYGDVAGSAAQAAGGWGPAAALPQRVAEDAGQLADVDLFFTASSVRLEEARNVGVRAFIVGRRLDREEPLSFLDVPRVVEEALRLPTARPMASQSRTGALVAIGFEGELAQARELAMSAMAEDPHADWVVLSDLLVVYTEEPDLEDRLADRPGARHLSHGVNVADVTVDVEGVAGEDVVVERDGLRLRVGPRDGAGTEEGRPGWAQVRRRVLRAPDRAAGGGTPSMPELVRAYRDRLEELSARATATRSHGTATLFSLVREVTGESAGADMILPGSAAEALFWTSPYRATEATDMVVLVHGGASSESLPEIVARALATSEVLRQVRAALGVLHWLPLSPSDHDEADVWRSALFADEVPRVSQVLRLDRGDTSAVADAVRAASAG